MLLLFLKFFCMAHNQVRLIVDGSKIDFGHQLLLVAIAYRKGAIPIDVYKS